MESDENLHLMNICQLILWRKFGFTLPLLFIPPLLSDFPMAAFLCKIQKRLSLAFQNAILTSAAGVEKIAFCHFFILGDCFLLKQVRVCLVPAYWFLKSSLKSSLKIKQGNLFHNTTYPWLFNLYVLACLVGWWLFVTGFHVAEADLKLAV